MALTPLATTNDVADRWRPLSDQEVNTARAYLHDASALIRARFPGIDAQITAGQVDVDAVAGVVANMVKRAMIAPADGISQQSESVGPYSRSQSYANPMGNVFLTQAEMTLILGYQPAASSHGFANDTAACGYGSYPIVYGW